MKAAVFGAGGHIGGRLAARLEAEGWEVLALGRGDERWRGAELGHVFFCVGLTADFRTRPFETIEAHVGFAGEVLRRAIFDSFLYLSSTRVYAKSGRGAETTPLVVDPGDPSDLYNLSKLMGEAACLAVDRPQVRIARLSNVYGDDPGSGNFLAAILREAAGAGAIRLHSALESEKDYIALDDVLAAMIRIAVAGSERLYNLASGVNTSHGAIVGAIRTLTGCSVSVEPGSPAIRFPAIAVERLRALGVNHVHSVVDALPALLAQAKAQLQTGRR